MATTQIVFSGNYIELEINGTVIGVAQTATLTYDLGYTPVAGFGSALVQQWVPGMATVSLTGTLVTLLAGNLEAAGVEPQNSLADAGAIPPFTVNIYTTPGGTLLKTITGCVFSQGSYDLAHNQPVIKNFTINGIDVAGGFVAASI